MQLLLTGVPRANFRRGVRPSISPRSKVITVRPLKLESSNVPRVNGHDGCLVCDHFCGLRSRFLALARPRDYGSLTGGNLMMRCGDTRCTVSCIASQAPRCSVLDSGRRRAWLLHVLQTMVSARGARSLQRTSCTRANEQYRLQLNSLVPAAVSFPDSLPRTQACAGIPPAGLDVLSLEESKCFLNYLRCCAADGAMALAREYGEMPEAPPFAFYCVEAERSMITPFWCPVLRCRCRDLSGRKALGSPVPFDTECCYLSVDGSCEPAVEESPVKCGWGLHVVRARSVLGQFCGPIVCGLLRENTRVFKLSNNLAELVALVHALEFVLSQPSSLNFMICFDSKVCCARGAAELAGEEPLGSSPIFWRTSQVL